VISIPKFIQPYHPTTPELYYCVSCDCPVSSKDESTGKLFYIFADCHDCERKKSYGQCVFAICSECLKGEE
jgi:hypothetical protein